MELGEFLEGGELTWRQAAIIAFTFLGLVILAGFLLVLFSDLFRVV
ncbi:hypothetical protein OB905_06860 [Halobacteria archaeon AArc-dxtr1]|nr:hypothetical protein [Halobacteria archaeon AArc-dxtr1]